MTRQTPRLLLATSGSAASRHATAIAADLASTFDAELTILHVIAPSAYRLARLGPILPISTRLDDPLSNVVLRDARRVAWTRGANPKPMLIAGDAARVIVAVAVDLGVDLLVIGSQRRLAPAALVAKTRSWVHAHASCPVLPITADRPALSGRGREPILAT